MELEYMAEMAERPHEFSSERHPALLASGAGRPRDFSRNESPDECALPRYMRYEAIRPPDASSARPRQMRDEAIRPSPEECALPRDMRYEAIPPQAVSSARPRDMRDEAIRPPALSSARPRDMRDEAIRPPALSSTRPRDMLDKASRPPALSSTRPRDMRDEAIRPPAVSSTRPRDMLDEAILPPAVALPRDMQDEAFRPPAGVLLRDMREKAIRTPAVGCAMPRNMREEAIRLEAFARARSRDMRDNAIQPHHTKPLEELPTVAPAQQQDKQPQSLSRNWHSNQFISIKFSDLVQQANPKIDPAKEEAQAKSVERELDEALRKGDFDLIQERVTPKTLSICKTNPLLKSFEVNKVLKDLVNRAVNPETDEIEMLSKAVDEYTYAFVSPLKQESDLRHTFKGCWDSALDKAIDTEQKKFVSHPVVYTLLDSTWYRSFTAARNKPWTSASRWGYLFLNFWSLLDMVLFPFFFALLLVVHLINNRLRRARATEICFIVTLNNDTASLDKDFDLIKRTISYIINEYGYQKSSANYSVILRKENDAFSDVTFDYVCSSDAALLNRVEALQKSDSSPRLYEDLCAARFAFKSHIIRRRAKKVLVVFINDTISSVVDAKDKDLNPVLKEIKELGVDIVPVGIGGDAKLSELKQIASENMTAFHVGEFESPVTLGKAIIQGVEGKDIFDLYMDYFSTPYFIFVRDMLSYVILLGLHFANCLALSTVAFSQLEWVILIFFLGRIAIEADQFVSAQKAERKAERQRLRQGPTTSSEKSVVLKKCTYYLSDRWNLLDFIILLTYIITFILRMATWAISATVSDNRPLAVAGYLYGLIAMLLTLRVFGHVLEVTRKVGAIQIALFAIIWDVLAILWQFLATILAFSLALTKIYVVEKSYSSTGKSDRVLACGDDGFTCWWTMAKHLIWSVLGIVELDPLNSVDNPSMTLSYLLYSLFLIMGVILLINMMIALLSNTYQRVQDNSLREWYFKKAITIKTYSSYHPVPVPFNLVSIPVMAIWRLCHRVSNRNRFGNTGVDESGKKAALDKLVKKLESIYFATYGYSFPLTDERKMDQLLHETDGSRRMANQIVHRVFGQRGCNQDKCIAGASAWESLGIGIKGCLLTYQGPDSCHVCRKEKEPKIFHGARYLMPFTRETPRMEVLFQESGERRILGVGVVLEKYNCHWMPGWFAGTVGYHVDDGKIFEPGYDELGREVEDAMAYRGDLIACEVDYDGETDGVFPIVFFLNGREVARASFIAGEMDMFPFISMGYEGIRVLAKMCPCDSGMAQVAHATPAQHIVRDAGTEQDLAHYVQKQFRMLREDINRERRAQTMEFQEQLEEQRKSLMEIRNLVLLLIRENKLKKDADDNDLFESQNIASSKSERC